MTRSESQSIIADYLNPEGILSKHIDHYSSRVEQLKMAEAVMEAINTQSNLIVEAGTGVGKTFAYLLPALLTEKKVILSTGSKTLQDQLLYKDVPIILKALQQTDKIMVLKGRANYLCLERLIKHYKTAEGQLFSSLLSELSYLREWSNKTKTGDISQCDNIPENSQIWGYVTSTNDNCLGSECGYFNDCFLFKARRRAMSAKLLVINHHLFFADLKLKQQDLGELTPDSGVFIFDEAHQLPEIASQFFGEQVSSRQLLDFAKDLQLFYETESLDWGQLQKSAEQLSFAIDKFRHTVSQIEIRSDLRQLFMCDEVRIAFDFLWEKLLFCDEVLSVGLGRSKLVDSYLARLKEFQQKLQSITEFTSTGFSYHFEANTHYFLLAITPLSVAAQFSELLEKKSQNSWIFTSATLSVNDNFNYFSQLLGLTDAKQLFLASPFDYPAQSLLYVPRYLPDLNHPNSAMLLAEKLAPLITLNKGRCFFLSTSHQMVQQLTLAFKALLDLPILSQGESSKTQLIQDFLQHGNALLIATQSFWEGVDIKGAALSCVIIDRIPFTSPEEPLLKAKIKESRLHHQDPFALIQLPEAIITLKQGVGRLIRHDNDSGVVVICDHRLISRAYGEIIIKSLPAFSRTRELSKVEHFLKNSVKLK